MVTAIWIFAGLGLITWSLLAWGIHSLFTLAPGWAAELKPWLERMPLGDWLDTWIPGWQSIAEALIDLAQALLVLLGEVVGELVPWLVWGTWAVGALLILGMAGLLHGIVRAANRPSAPASQPALG